MMIRVDPAGDLASLADTTPRGAGKEIPMEMHLCPGARISAGGSPRVDKEEKEKRSI